MSILPKDILSIDIFFLWFVYVYNTPWKPGIANCKQQEFRKEKQMCLFILTREKNSFLNILFMVFTRNEGLEDYIYVLLFHLLVLLWSHFK